MKESTCGLDHPAAAKFRQCVIDGDWNKAEAHLSELESLLDDSCTAMVCYKAIKKKEHWKYC